MSQNPQTLRQTSARGFSIASARIEVTRAGGLAGEAASPASPQWCARLARLKLRSRLKGGLKHARALVPDLCACPQGVRGAAGLPNPARLPETSGRKVSRAIPRPRR